MKKIWTAFLLTLMLWISACSKAPALPAAPAQAEQPVTAGPASTAAPAAAQAQVTAALASNSSPDSKPLLRTSVGDFLIDSSRWVDEVNGVKPGKDEKILLVILTQPGLERIDPEKFSLEAFSNAMHDVSDGEVHISGDDGSYTISTMAGWVGENYDEFAMGFRLPVTAKNLQLFWPGNEPIEIAP